MIYAGFDYYANEYLGSALSEADYPRMAARASRYLDYITQGRAEQNRNMEAVKLACCALAEQYQVLEAAQALTVQSLTAGRDADGAELQSQTVGPWSKTYRSGGESAQGAIQAAQAGRSVLLDTVRQYLAHTGLLYRGGRCGQ